MAFKGNSEDAEKEEAKRDIFTAVMTQHMYNQVHDDAYPIALDVVTNDRLRKNRDFVTDSNIGVALANKKMFETCIVSCKEFTFLYDTGEFSDRAKQSFGSVSESRREEFLDMLVVFERALNITKDAVLRYRLRKHGSDAFREILKDGSDFQTIKHAHRNSIDFYILKHNCDFILDTAKELEFDLREDEVLNNFVEQLKKLMYAIRGKEQVEEMFNASWHEDDVAAFKALYEENDPKKAMQLYERAADAGSGEAMYELGQLYRHFWRPCINAELHGKPGGHPVAKDMDKAIEWFKKAADKNYAPAMEELGSIYEVGEYAPKNIYTAIHWYKKSVIFGSSKAIGTLARIYQEGVVVSKDVVEARRWREMRSFDGYFEGLERLKAEFNPNAPVQTAEITAPWMNPDAKPAKSYEPVEEKVSVTKKSPAAKTPPVEKSSDDNEQTKTEFDKDDAPGFAFWGCLIVLYGFTSADLMTSGIVAFIAAGVVYFIINN